MKNNLESLVKVGTLVTLNQVINDMPITEQKAIEEKVRYIKIAMAIRKLRKEKKLTQSELAKRINTKREYISRVESGNQNITLETLYQIAAATNKEVILNFE